jgi:hypothetical protein
LFSKICPKISTRIMGTFPEDQYTFMVITHSILLRMRNVSHKIVDNVKTHSLCPITFLKKKYHLRDVKNTTEPGRL